MKKFIKPYGIMTPPIKKVFKWKIASLFQKKQALVEDDNFKLTVQPLSAENLQRDDDFIVWLGHATFYIQLDGVKILTDPVFGDIPLTPRLAKFPINGQDLKPDIILISHGHYDHLDMKSLAILDIYAKECKVVMPLGLSSYFKKPINFVELDWYDKCKEYGISIESVPASHWHRRGVFDFNRALWCSFVIKSKNRTLFFAGDTAMDSHFEEIAKKAYDIDMALMPIGAYNPTEIMGDNHMNPQEALEATNTLNIKQMIPYHYGTFNLSAEPIGEPHSWITRLSKKSDVDISILDVGEIKVL